MIVISVVPAVTSASIKTTSVTVLITAETGLTRRTVVSIISILLRICCRTTSAVLEGLDDGRQTQFLTCYINAEMRCFTVHIAFDKMSSDFQRRAVPLRYLNLLSL